VKIPVTLGKVFKALTFLKGAESADMRAISLYPLTVEKIDM
jgi:hypothetical protein